MLGKRGFSAVHLVEAEAEIGGRLRWTRRLPTLGDWGRVTDWRAVQLDKLPGVEVITGRRLSAADILDYGAEIVVIATGSSWRGDGVQPGQVGRISGADAGLPNVLTPEQVGAGKRPVGRNVIVYDTDGYYVGPGVAELLAGEGFAVTAGHLVPRALAGLRPHPGGRHAPRPRAPPGGQGAARDHDHRDRAGLGPGPGRVRRSLVRRLRRGGAGHPAGLERRAVCGTDPRPKPRWRGRASGPCT